MSDFVVVIGRIKPIGDAHPVSVADATSERRAVVLAEDGRPWCQQVQLERIVKESE